MAESSRTANPERDAPDPGFWRPPDGPSQEQGYPPRPSEWGGPLDRFVDRVRELRGDPRVGIAGLLVIALVAGFIWYRLGVSDSGASSTPSPAPTSATPTSASAATENKGDRVTIHVAGAVAKAGVYELEGGARVIDAVEAAGGGLPEADLNRLNLAARLADGQRVHIPLVGEVVSPAPGAAVPDASGDPSGAGLVSLNTATQAQLEELPGIGPVLAEAILAERDRRGGFRSVNELRDVRGIGDKRFADLQDKVSV